MVIGIDAGALCIEDDRLKVGVYRVTREAIRALLRSDHETSPPSISFQAGYPFLQRFHASEAYPTSLLRSFVRGAPAFHPHRKRWGIQAKGHKNEYRLYSFGRGIRELGGSRIKEVRLPKTGWNKVWLPLELKRYPVDVFLGFAQALPASQKSYNIGFIYDLGFFYRPDVYGQAAIALKRQTETLVRRANHIITISHASKEDILYEYDLQSSCVSVAYPGVDLIFSPAGNAYRAKRPYVLFVGSLNKAKDIPTLLTTVADTPYDVYLIGGDFWPDPAIDETIERLRIGDRVKKLGVVPDEELLKYYRGAIAVATTALREGFCLPAAEAMACGTPVVALDRGALREIVAEGGIIAKNTKEFRDALMRLGDKKIRAVFSKKAVVQAKQYRWETFAKHILTCIDSDIRHPGLDPGSSSK